MWGVDDAHVGFTPGMFCSYHWLMFHWLTCAVIANALPPVQFERHQSIFNATAVFSTSPYYFANYITPRPREQPSSFISIFHSILFGSHLLRLRGIQQSSNHYTEHLPVTMSSDSTVETPASLNNKRALYSTSRIIPQLLRHETMLFSPTIQYHSHKRTAYSPSRIIPQLRRHDTMLAAATQNTTATAMPWIHYLNSRRTVYSPAGIVAQLDRHNTILDGTGIRFGQNTTPVPTPTMRMNGRRSVYCSARIIPKLRRHETMLSETAAEQVRSGVGNGNATGE